jgi:hypothetical protein
MGDDDDDDVTPDIDLRLDNFGEAEKQKKQKSIEKKKEQQD